MVDKEESGRNTKVLPVIQEGSQEERKNDSLSISREGGAKGSGSISHPNAAPGAVSSGVKS